MLREHRDLIRKIHLFLDGLCIYFAWVVAYLCLPCFGIKLEGFQTYFFALALFTFVVLSYLFIRRFRPGEHLGYSFKAFRELCYAVFLGMLLEVFVFYLFKTRHFSRTFLISSGSLSLIFLLVWNVLVFYFYRGLRERGLNYQHLLLIGNAYTLPPVVRAIRERPELGQRIEAAILIGNDAMNIEFEDLRIYRGAESIAEVLNTLVVDNAFFTVYRQDPKAVEKMMLDCQERGINVWLKPDFMQGALVSRVDYISDIPLFVFSLGPKYGLSLVLKRAFDVVAAFLLLLAVIFPMVVVAMLVKLTPGPVFFMQKRVGLNGRRFMMAKFRTMYKDAEQRRAEYNLKNEMKGPVFKMKNDPRITPVGRFLRKYSLDELPQFWSVLMGDMSLVGPRPPIPTEVDLYQGWQRRRLSMRPGITCIWQVTGRNKISDFNEWARLDLDYIDKWSLWLDLKILIKTIPAVLEGSGS